MPANGSPGGSVAGGAAAAGRRQAGAAGRGEGERHPLPLRHAPERQTVMTADEFRCLDAVAPGAGRHQAPARRRMPRRSAGTPAAPTIQRDRTAPRRRPSPVTAAALVAGDRRPRRRGGRTGPRRPVRQPAECAARAGDAAGAAIARAQLFGCRRGMGARSGACGSAGGWWPARTCGARGRSGFRPAATVRTEYSPFCAASPGLVLRWIKSHPGFPDARPHASSARALQECC